MKRVYVGGTFDLFHRGHVNLLREAKRLGRVFVSVNPDEFVEKFKGSKPIISLNDRIEVLDACIYVDKVVVNEGGEDSKIAINKVKPHIILAGDDWKDKDYLGQLGIDQTFLDKNKIELVFVPYTKGISSTLIKRKLWMI